MPHNKNIPSTWQALLALAHFNLVFILFGIIYIQHNTEHIIMWSQFMIYLHTITHCYLSIVFHGEINLINISSDQITKTEDIWKTYSLPYSNVRLMLKNLSCPEFPRDFHIAKMGSAYELVTCSFQIIKQEESHQSSTEGHYEQHPFQGGKLSAPLK